MDLFRLSIYTKIYGEDLQKFLKQSADENVKSLEEHLSKYDNEYCTKVWSKFIWYLEEFINVFYELDQKNKLKILQSPIECFLRNFDDSDNASPLGIIQHNFGKDVATRFNDFIKLFRDIKDEERICIINDLLDFCQLRRLHYLSILYILSKFAKGSKKIKFANSVNIFQKYVDLHLAPLTTTYQSMLLNSILPDFHLKIYPSGKMIFSEYSSPLEYGFLEPQTMTSLDIAKYCTKIDESRLWKKSIRRLYSMDEYDAILNDDTVYYEYFNLADKPIYNELCAFYICMKDFFTDEYHVKVSEAQFQKLRGDFPNLTFYKEQETIFDIQNNRFVFCKIGDYYYSTYFLIIRYYTNELQRILRKIRKYQINAGFLFEKMVTDIMKNNGFKVEQCKRIEHKEFDVVCTKNGKIYNFQCKNNFYDVTKIDTRTVDVAVRYNNKLARYYDRALKKEYRRENLLKKKLQLDDVIHYVISRYPIITNNKNVIAFNRLDEFLNVID